MLPKCLGYGKKNFPEITSGDAGNRKGNLQMPNSPASHPKLQLEEKNECLKYLIQEPSN